MVNKSNFNIQVGLQTTTTRTHCECNHLTWFGARVIVPPNTISFTNISERIKDPRNYATILSVLCSLLVLYCLILVWARRRDIQDRAKVSRVLMYFQALGPVYMNLVTRVTLSLPPSYSRRSKVTFILQRLKGSLRKKVLNSFRLVWIAWEWGLHTKEGDPSRRNKFCRCKQFALATREKFRPYAWVLSKFSWKK